MFGGVAGVDSGEVSVKEWLSELLRVGFREMLVSRRDFGEVFVEGSGEKVVEGYGKMLRRKVLALSRLVFGGLFLKEFIDFFRVVFSGLF